MTPKKSKKAKPSTSLEEEKELINIKVDAMKLKHKMKMDELTFVRETERLYHERKLERGRIKNAEIRKNFAFKRSYN